MKKLLSSLAIILMTSSVAFAAPTYEAVTGSNEAEDVNSVVIKEVTPTTKEVNYTLTALDAEIAGTEVNITNAQADVAAWQARLAALQALRATILAEVEKVDLYVPAVADFDASPTSGEAPLQVTFTDKSTGDIASRAWDFGDGGSSVEASPKHTYSDAKPYTATLTVTDVKGKTSSKSVAINQEKIGEVEPK